MDPRVISIARSEVSFAGAPGKSETRIDDPPWIRTWTNEDKFHVEWILSGRLRPSSTTDEKLIGRPTIFHLIEIYYRNGSNYPRADNIFHFVQRHVEFSGLIAPDRLRCRKKVDFSMVRYGEMAPFYYVVNFDETPGTRCLSLLP